MAHDRNFYTAPPQPSEGKGTDSFNRSPHSPSDIVMVLGKQFRFTSISHVNVLLPEKGNKGKR